MSFSTAASKHVYHGNPEIYFSNDQSGLSVTVATDRLRLRSIEANEEEYGRYSALFGDKTVMEKFATGKTETPQEIIRKIKETWAHRWRERDPYSGFAVFEKNTSEFLGHIELEHSAPGEAELIYLFNRSIWGKGYGTEAALAIVEYARATIQKGYILDGKPLKRIVATARIDNIASNKILRETIGMQFLGKKEKFGALRNHYVLPLNDTSKFCILQ